MKIYSTITANQPWKIAKKLTTKVIYDYILVSGVQNSYKYHTPPTTVLRLTVIYFYKCVVQCCFIFGWWWKYIQWWFILNIEQPSYYTIRHLRTVIYIYRFVYIVGDGCMCNNFHNNCSLETHFIRRRVHFIVNQSGYMGTSKKDLNNLLPTKIRMCFYYINT